MHMLDITTKNIVIGVMILVAVAVVYWMVVGLQPSESGTLSAPETSTEEAASEMVVEPLLTPIEHASFILTWGDEVLYFDPVGEVTDYDAYPAPTAIFITDIHGDHLNKDVIGALMKDGVDLIVPMAVKDELPTDLAMRASVMENGGVRTLRDITVTAVPMYNLPGESEKFHEKGRGNGYLLERDGYTVYNAGDTAGTPEMKALTDIDMAFVPMNLPYTMNVDDAAEAVLAFAPKVVYPFHYRGPDGLSDVEGFKSKVNAANPDIEVRLASWYPQKTE
jgi:L-ascorbate metabolism protein UlaG (beta-lactamase superfamily)